MDYEIQELFAECHDDPCHCHMLNSPLSSEDRARIQARVNELITLVKDQSPNDVYNDLLP